MKYFSFFLYGFFCVIFLFAAIPRYNYSAPADVDFNERFSWEQPGGMASSYEDALKRGLPFPILAVAEYLSLGQEGFAWGGQYRAAGYYAGILLW